MGLNNNSEGQAIYVDWTCFDCGTVNARVVNEGYSHKYVIPTHDMILECKECDKKQKLARDYLYDACDN